MCRHHLLWGCALMALGLGVLIGTWLEGSFWPHCLGFVLLILGFFVGKRK